MNFPDAPVNGQQFTANGVTWYYNSSIPAWTGGAVMPLTAMVILAPVYAATLSVDISPYVAYPIVLINVGTLTGPINFDIIGGTDGQIIRARLKQDVTGGRVFAAGAHLRFSVDTPLPVLSVAGNKMDRLAFEWHSSGFADLIAVNKGY